MISQNFIENNFPKGKLTLVGGRPNIGKSSFAISLAISMAEQNQRVIYFSLEMTKEQLIRRIKLQNEQIAIEENIIIDDLIKTKPGYVRSQLETKSFDCILIDYIQLMEADNKALSREEEMSSIVCSLKKIARELDVPIIALSQTPRNSIDLKEFFRPVDLIGTNTAFLFREREMMEYKFGENISRLYFNDQTVAISDMLN